MGEDIRLAFIGIWAHKMRSFLTMLGIIIGIASIISIVSTIKGTQEQIKQNLIGSGNNTVTVQLKSGDSPYMIQYEGMPKGITMVSVDQLEDIKANHSVSSVATYTERQYADGIRYNGTTLDGASVIGIDNSYFSTCGYTIREGRGFTAKDYTDFNKVVIVDESASKSLFSGEDPIGKTIEISSQPFTVVGITVLKNVVEPVINSIQDYRTYHQSEAGRVFMPQTSWPIVYNYDEPQNMVVRAKSTEQMSDAGKAAADILNANISSDATVKYQAEDVLETARNLQSLSQSTNQQLIWIASISLLVGGIGVMNIMLVSVTERTREIGLKKAIGARKRRILIQFLTESAVLTSVGGVIGVITGIIMSSVISKISSVPVAVSVPSIILSVGFSVVIGLVFGILPATKAAKLNPIDALRYE